MSRQKIESQWTELANILRKPAPNATWMSSLEGALRCSWPGTACFMLTVGATVTFRLYDPPLQEAILLLASLYLAALIGNMIDMVWDCTSVDAICAPHRPIPSGIVSPLFVWHGALLGMFLAWILAWQTGSRVAMSIVATVLTTLFFLPSISRCNKVMGEFLLAIVYSVGVWVPPLVMEHSICQAQPHCHFRSVWFQLDVWPVALVSILFHFQRDVALDIADVQGDKAASLRTIPTMLGHVTAYWTVLSILAISLIVPIAILETGWHSDWPQRSKVVFFTSTLIFVGSCALGFVLVLHQKHEDDTSGKESKTKELNVENANISDLESGLEEEGQLDQVHNPGISYPKSLSSRRSHLRRLMKAEFVGYVVWVLVNILVGY